MKFRYALILLIGFLAAALQTENSASCDNPDFIIPEFELAAEQFDIFPSDSQLNLPNHSNISKIPRANANARRAQIIGFSKTCVLDYAGRIASVHTQLLDVSLCNSLQSENTDVIEHLITLGRLII